MSKLEAPGKVAAWTEFLESIIRLVEVGSDDREISASWRGKLIEGEGTILDVKLNEECAPGIALSMELGMVPLRDGRVMRADYQFLNIPSSESAQWGACKVGDLIRFKALISKSPGPFPEIQLTVFEGDPEVILTVGLYEASLISLRR